jgi:hypothetical protein
MSEPLLTAPRPPPPPLELSARIRAAVAAAPPPPRTTFAMRVGMGLLVAVGCVAATTLASRRDFRDVPTRGLLVTSGALLVLAFAVTALSIARGRRGLGASSVALLLAAVLATPVYGLVTAVVPLSPLKAVAEASLAYGLRTGAMCAAFGCALGAIVLSGFTWALRRAVPVSPVARGAALGAGAGAIVGLALHLFCPHFDRPHIVLGHVLPVAMFAVLGALLTPRTLRP